MADNDLTILAFAGSLRVNSYNRGLIRLAEKVAPEGLRLKTFDIAPIPLYNEDVEKQGDPEPVRRFKEAIAAADALLIATPEYNYSVPGVLKNAIDWASRPPQTSPLKRKPVALIGASGGPWGTTRAQLALRQSFVFTETPVLPKPELYVPNGRERFDEQGNLKDSSDPTAERLADVLTALAAWTKQVGEPRA